MNILFILSSRDKFGDTERGTGTWLEELLRPYYYLVDSGVKVDFASPKGGAAPIDPASIEALQSDPIFKRYQEDAALKGALAKVPRLADVAMDRYQALIYPGGHGPLWDLKDDPNSVKAIESFLQKDKPVGTICHAGCVLLSAKGKDGKPLVNGKTLTAFSDSEEAAVGLQTAVPYVVENELVGRGAKYQKAGDWQEHVLVDGKLVTGQNPASALGVAKAVFSILSR